MAAVGKLRAKLTRYQQQGVDHCVTAFALGASHGCIYAPDEASRAVLGVHVAHKTAPAGTSLILVPKATVLEQVADTWQRAGRHGRYLGLWPDHQPEDRALRRMLIKVRDETRLAAEVAKADGPVSVFATYATWRQVATAYRRAQLPVWDLLICHGPQIPDPSSSPPTHPHKPLYVPSRHRLELRSNHSGAPALPRPDVRLHTEVRTKDGLYPHSPTSVKISLADVVDQGLLPDYRLIAFNVADQELHDILNLPAVPSRTAALHMAAAQAALLHAMYHYDLQRVLAFHTTTELTRTFIDTLADAAAMMPKHTRTHLHTGMVTADQSRPERLAAVEEFIRAGTSAVPQGRRPPRAVLAAYPDFAADADVPAIDAVFFASPQISTTALLQAVSRALQPLPLTARSPTIILPLCKARGQAVSAAVQGTRFHTLHQVLFDLGMYDRHILCPSHGSRRYPPPIEGGTQPERVDEIIPVLRPTAQHTPDAVWLMGLRSARRYFNTHHHLNVPSNYQDSDGFYLGTWQGRQRTLRMHGRLSPDHVAALDVLPMLWPHPEHSIEHYLYIAREFAHSHGHLRPEDTQSMWGVKLGQWLAEQRHHAAAGTLALTHQRALTEIDPWWNAPWSATWNRAYSLTQSLFHFGDVSFPDLHSGCRWFTGEQWLDQQIDHFPHLHPDQQALLEALPLDHPLALLLCRPRSPAEHEFTQGLRVARAYLRTHHHLNVPDSYVTREQDSACALGPWLSSQRMHPHRLTDPQRAALTALIASADSGPPQRDPIYRLP